MPPTGIVRLSSPHALVVDVSRGCLSDPVERHNVATLRAEGCLRMKSSAQLVTMIEESAPSLPAATQSSAAGSTVIPHFEASSTTSRKGSPDVPPGS